VSVGRQVRDAGGVRSALAAELELGAVEPHDARGALQAGQRTQQVGLAVARDAGDADDLARRDGEADVVELVAAEVLDLEHGRLRGGVIGRALVGERRLDAAPDDELDDLVVAERRHRRGRAHGAVAQDADAIGDQAHLGQAMRDVDDRRALRGDLAHERQHVLGHVGP
jgi:hypothetical protein